MGHFLQQFRIFLWKNALLKLRNYRVLLLELIIPCVILLALIAIRSVVSPSVSEEFIPSDTNLYYSNNLQGVYNFPWCNMENLLWRCVSDGTCAQTSPTTFEGCQRKYVAVTTSSENTSDAWAAATQFVTWGNEFAQLPENETAFVLFQSEDQFETLTKSKDYSLDPSVPIYSAEVVFSSGYPSWDYTVRMNKTIATFDGDNAVPETSAKPVDDTLKTGDQDPATNRIYMKPYMHAYIDSFIFVLTDTVTSFIGTKTCRNVGLCSDSEDVVLRMQGALDFPHLRTESDGFWTGMGDFFPLLMIISLLYPLSNAIKSLVVEKETRMREGYMIMSLRSDVYWSTWIINFVALFLPLSIILTIVGENLFTYSDAVFIFFYFFLFFMASMSYCILISVFFSKSKSASIIGSLVFFAGYFIYVGLATDSTLTRTELMVACLHPASAFTYGTLAFKEYESSKIGVTRYTFDASNDYNITFIDTLVVQVINFIYLLVLAAYFGEVWPSEFGTCRPWYFPAQPSFWKSKFRWVTQMFAKNESIKRVNDSSKPRGSVEMVHRAGSERTTAEKGLDNYEPISEDLKAQIESKRCVQIKNLVKTFDTATGLKTAVDNLSLDVFSGQITALLGHNGAGKTTTISMMTGLIPVTSGTATVCGHDLVDELSDIRKMIGYCPQHDVLIGNMTVEEHLYLFANIKGCPPAEVRDEVEKMIVGVGLIDKRNDYADNLSGGQKRKLSLAIAFIGKSRVVFLDEPTSGMDPYSRRFTWNVIRKYREGRIIILTTHFMDEADLLGDRIAIMADGRLRCCGSSLYLKQKYGVGYNLTIEKGDAVHFNSKDTVNLIKQFVPESAVITDVGTELTLELPFSGSASFESMFDTLERRSADLGVLSYSISATTLEEVFIRVAAGIAKERGQALTVRKKELESEKISHQKSVSLISGSAKEVGIVAGQASPLGAPESGSPSASKHVDAEIPFTSIPAEEIEKYHEDASFTLFFVHFIALFQKRFYYFKRDTKSWAFQYGVPVVFIIIGMIVMRYSAFTTNQPSLVLDPSVYNPDFTTDIFPIPYTSNNLFCYENGFCKAIQGQDEIMSMMTNGALLPVETQPDAIKMYNISEFLLAQRDDYASARFGAVSFSTINNFNTNGVLSYVEFSVHSNFTGVHAAPITAALVAEAIVKTLNPNVSIVTRLHPLPETPSEETRNNSFNTTNVILFILLAIPFIPASFAMFVVREKELKSKHLQLVSGVSIASYWIATWAWDVTTYMITAWLMILVIAVFPGTELFTQGQSFSGVIALFMLFGAAAPPFAYLCSFFLTQSAGTQTVILFINFITGLILMIVGIILRIIPSTRDIYLNVVRYIFMLFPAHAFGDGLDSVVIKELWSFYELGGGRQYGVFDLNITGYNLIFLAWETVVYLSLVIIIDYVRQTPWLYAKLVREFKPPHTKDEDQVDEDVKAEEEKVLSGHYDTSGPGGTPASVILRNIKKVYPGGNYAVRGVSLAVNNGECFGLLGINGAGKSTLLGLISGEFPPSAGTASLGGLDVLKDIHKCRHKIGFCPQFDSLFDLLTGREHLELYARIKGIKPEYIKSAVATKIVEMGLVEYADRSAGTYSGGNKRKLSVAMSMIGEPSIVFLDEPSTGMDPVARRFMWEIISDISTKREKCSIILTTQSMEECEALCTRIGIMVGGRLRCLGSGQHLRDRFGLGYQLEISFTVPDADVDPVAHEKILEIQRALNISPNSEVAPVDVDVEEGDMTPTGTDAIRISEAQVRDSLNILGKADWLPRISKSGSGSELLLAIETNKSVGLKHFATWWIMEEVVDRFVAFADKNLSGYHLRERQANRLRLSVPLLPPRADGDVGVIEPRTLSKMFGCIEPCKDQLGIKEYSVAQTSLEQIFNTFASKQSEETDESSGIF